MVLTPCAAYGCKNSRSNNPGLCFIRIPKDRCHVWVELLANPALRGLTPEQLCEKRVCGSHFLDKDFKNARRNSINWNVNPSLKLHVWEESADDVCEAHSSSTATALPPPCAPPPPCALPPPHDTPLHPPVATSNDILDASMEEVLESVEMTSGAASLISDTLAQDLNNNLKSIIQNNSSDDHNYSKESAAKPSADAHGLAPLPRLQSARQSPLINSLLTSARKTRMTYLSLKRRYQRKCTEIRQLKKNREENALQVIKNKISPALFKILKCQTRNHDRKPQGYRYEEDEKVVFLGINQTGPKSYRSLPIIKPTRKTIKKSLEDLNFQPGVHSIMMSALKSRASGMSEEMKEVIIIFDETAAKVRFTYDRQEDKIIGFVDLGNGVRRALPGEEVMVAMVRSIYGRWKQPLGFWYTHRKLTATDFKNIFSECIAAVIDTGLRPRCMVTDGLAKNASAVKGLGATLDSPFFFIDEHKVFALSDVPHLLKSLRNALMSYNLQLQDGSLVKKEYIDKFIRMDMTMQPRLVKKVTETHLAPNNFQKMSVSLAAQLLHRKVAAGIMVYSILGALPHEATVTAKFCERIHNFFDSWNGIVVDDSETFKKAMTENSGHLQLWGSMFTEIEHWKFIGSTNLQFPTNFLIAMKAVYQLWCDLQKEGYSHLPVGHINQDCLENFFGMMRSLGGHRHTISLHDVPSLFASALIRNLTTSVKDVTFYFYEPQSNEEEREEEVDEDLFEIEEDEETVGTVVLTSEEICQKVVQGMGKINCASVVAPLIQRHCNSLSCDACCKILQTAPKFPLHALHTLSSTSQTSTQQQPSEEFIKCVEDIYNTAFNYIPPNAHAPKILESLVSLVHDLPSVKRFKLCPLHIERQDAIWRDVSFAALDDVILSLNQNYKVKRRDKKCQKLQVVSHR
ncbi:Transposable element P transposase [Frankliniella fusca]|uniref:Transposable element P transposase n=1 Tax=Frankliniella fusca TaxID=407009 RepID=A0AAE1LGG7_9NEOP|nr:Transposable element P transposase [Frankliniella fusca]